MTQAHHRKLEDRILSLLRELAQRNGRSLEAELRQLLRDESLRTRRRIAAELKEMRDTMYVQHGPMADTTEILRHIRDTK